MKSLNDKSLNDEILKLLRLEEVDSDSDDMETEASTSSGVAAYNTPNAFASSKDEDDLDDDHIEVLGYKKVPKKKHKFYVSESDSLYKQMMVQMQLQEDSINEVSYNVYRKDETMTSKQKVNKSIKEISRRLFEIERIVNQNVRLKREDGIDNGQYWKSTKEGLYKISERLLKIAKQVRDISA